MLGIREEKWGFRVLVPSLVAPWPRAPLSQAPSSRSSPRNCLPPPPPLLLVPHPSQARLETRLLELFPQHRRGWSDFDAHFEAAGLTELVEYNKKKRHDQHCRVGCFLPAFSSFRGVGSGLGQHPGLKGVVWAAVWRSGSRLPTHLPPQCTSLLPQEEPHYSTSLCVHILCAHTCLTPSPHPAAPPPTCWPPRS